MLILFYSHTRNKGIGTGDSEPLCQPSLTSRCLPTTTISTTGTYVPARQLQLLGVPKYAIYLSLCLWIL